MRTLKEYRVVWEIDCVATTPEEAVMYARGVQLRTSSTATVFKVKEHGKKRYVTMDLDEKNEKQAKLF